MRDLIKRKGRLRASLLMGSIVVAVSTNSQAATQANPSTPQEEQSTIPAEVAQSGASPARLSPAATSEAAARADDGGLADIVVTAQKQAQSLQRTPAAVTAIDSETLVSRGVTDIVAAQNLVPSVRFQAEAASTEIYIRGVGSTLDFGNIEPPTGFNFNGIYIPREGTGIPLFDIDRIEVLPGPQGTLYGRSALGGTVNVSFARPTQQRETKVLFETGNYNLVHSSVAYNAPINEDLAVRLAVDYTYREGYLEGGGDSRQDAAARLSLLYKPSSAFSIYLWGYGVSRNGHPGGFVTKGFDPETGQLSQDKFLNKDPWNDVLTGDLAAFAPFGSPKSEDQHYKNYMVGGELNIDLGGGVSLTYIPSYFYVDWYQDYWISALPSFISARYNQYTQEVRLSGENGRLKWLAGLYAYRVVNSGDIIIFTSVVSNVERNRLQGIGGFAQGTYSLTDSLRMTLGGRYSSDDRTGRGKAMDPAGALTLPYDFNGSFSRFDWRLGVEYDVGPRSMVYASVQTGYQPGTYNQFPSSVTYNNRVKSSTLTAYTVGIKNRFLNNRLQINNEVYYYDYKNLLLQSFNADVAFNEVFNAPKVEIYGDQLDILFRPSETDQLNLTVGYLHARSKSLPLDLQPFEGLMLQYSPTWTVSAGYQHDFRLNAGYIRARVDTRYESHFWGDFRHTFGTRQQSYMKTDASLTYFSDDGGWSFGGWIKNIENEAVIAAAAGGGLPGPALVGLEAPRTYGVRAGMNF